VAAQYRKLVAERNSMLSSGFYNEPLNEVLSDRIDTISQKWREKRQAFLQLVQASLNYAFLKYLIVVTVLSFRWRLLTSKPFFGDAEENNVVWFSA